MASAIRMIREEDGGGWVTSYPNREDRGGGEQSGVAITYIAGRQHKVGGKHGEFMSSSPSTDVR